MTLIRVLIPSWRFFERLGHVPELYYRVKINGHFEPWTNCLEKPKHRVYNLFFNPKGNLYLACHTLIDRLLNDSQLKDIDFESHISFELIKNLVRQKVTKTHSDATHFEFKVIVTEYEDLKPTTTQVFTTSEYKL